MSKNAMAKCIREECKDCFARSQQFDRCTILKENIKGEKCRFFKTQEDFDKGIKKYGGLKKS